MSKIISKTFKKHLADQFVESFNEPANNIYYMTASKHTQYSGGDDVIPDPVDSVSEFQIAPYNDAVFGVKIQASDVSLVIPKSIYESGIVYSRYDDTDPTLQDKRFYAAVLSGSYYYVYKVLDNNNNSISLSTPSDTTETACNFITETDGYKWKLMYKMGASQFNKFTTASFMPVATSSNVASVAVSGAIDVYKINNAGSNYTATLSGQFTENDLREAIPSGGSNLTYRLDAAASNYNDFYKNSALYISGGTGAGQIRKITGYNGGTRIATVNSAFTTPPSTDSTYLIRPNISIVGDGSGASAYAEVNSNTTVTNFISSIVVIGRGEGYTYATTAVEGNTGGVAVTTSISPIIPPIGGHGSDAAAELGCDSVAISSSFNTDGSGFIPVENDYRQITILKDPLFDNVTFTIDTNDNVGTFTVGETIYEVDYSTLIGSVSTSSTTQTITGVGTTFESALLTGDYVILVDTITNSHCLRRVEGITDDLEISISANCSFTTAYGSIAKATILATAVKTGNATPYITCSNTVPKFQTNKRIIGGTSGAWASITQITVGEKNFNNWSTFDNRTRIAYTANTGVFANDAVVYQLDPITSNAYFHSANSGYVFLTSEKGPINAAADQPLLQVGGTSSYTLGTVKYTSDIVKNSGQFIYIENSSPITRSASQSETFRLVLQF